MPPPLFFSRPTRLIKVCKPWRRELEKRGFCNKTLELCSTLAEGWDVARLMEYAQRRLEASTVDAERIVFSQAIAFLYRSSGRMGSLPEWLHAASLEEEHSFLAKGAAPTAQVELPPPPLLSLSLALSLSLFLSLRVRVSLSCSLSRSLSLSLSLSHTHTLSLSETSRSRWRMRRSFSITFLG